MRKSGSRKIDENITKCFGRMNFHVRTLLGAWTHPIGKIER